jgi:hypothetical protein
MPFNISATANSMVFHHFSSLVVVRYLFLVYRLRFHRFSALVICISRRLTLLQLNSLDVLLVVGQLFLQQLAFFHLPVYTNNLLRNL